MEYTAQLLAVMQDKAESRGGVAVLGTSPMPLLRVLACWADSPKQGIHRREPVLLCNFLSQIP